MTAKSSTAPKLDLDPKRVGHYARGEKPPHDDEFAERVDTALAFVESLLGDCEIVLLVSKAGSGMIGGSRTTGPESTAAMLSECLQALLEPDVFRSFMGGLSEREHRRHAEESEKNG